MFFIKAKYAHSQQIQTLNNTEAKDTCIKIKGI